MSEEFRVWGLKRIPESEVEARALLTGLRSVGDIELRSEKRENLTADLTGGDVCPAWGKKDLVLRDVQVMAGLLADIVVALYREPDRRKAHFSALFDWLRNLGSELRRLLEVEDEEPKNGRAYSTY